MPDKSRICLPRPKRITLYNFSLYDNAPTITAEFGTGVFCLAGANGLGKSTFLAALNFAITGIVASPDRRYIGVDEYYQESLSDSADFFRGRISKKDADEAELVLEMYVGTTEYRITRGMFEPRGLRELSIVRSTQTTAPETFNQPGLTSTRRHEIYARNIVADSGLESFEQLVFLQHFVVTFDERRHLLFWDERVAQSALFMAFGVDLETAAKAETLRRAAERADSRVRNLQWQATELRGKRRHLEQTIAAQLEEQNRDGKENAADLVNEHRELQTAQRDVSDRVARLEAQLRDIDLAVAEATAERQVATTEFSEIFEANLARSAPSVHPVVARSVESSHCAVCSTRSEDVSREIQRRIDSGHCPLCGSNLPVHGTSDEEVAELLTRLQANITRLAEQVRLHSSERKRIEGELMTSRDIAYDISSRLSEFERENEAAIAGQADDSTATNSVVAEYGRQIAELNKRKKEQLEKRSAARQELAVLQEELAQAYATARHEFVPLFKQRAYEFLGLDLDVGFELQRYHISLVLSMQGTRRREQEALSESQRFFIDIALRMALAQQLVGSAYPAILYIDTPEGSLDIAYESRAGQMFANFVREGNQLVMTANINTSQLLHSLAARSGPSRMKLRRMTDWCSLSDVQSAAEELFDDAYSAIEADLEAGGE